jgi:hypothetical protein
MLMLEKGTELLPSSKTISSSFAAAPSKLTELSGLVAAWVFL